MRLLFTSCLVLLLALPGAVAGPGSGRDPLPPMSVPALGVESPEGGLVLIWTPEPTASHYSVYRQVADAPEPELLGETMFPYWYDEDAGAYEDAVYTVVAHLLSGETETGNEMDGGNGACVYRKGMYVSVSDNCLE